MATQAFLAGRADNELRQCGNRGCSKSRYGMNRWCEACNRKAVHYGDPRAGPLKRSQWAPERAQVAALIAANADHPGVRSIVAYLEQWSAEACANEQAFKGATEIARLTRHGIKPLALLTEACAFWLWLDRHPLVLPSDRAADFALSRALFGMAPRPRRQTRGPGGVWPVNKKLAATCSYAPKAKVTALAYIGKHLRGVLAPFFSNLAASLERQAEQLAAREAAMRAPLVAPTDL